MPCRWNELLVLGAVLTMSERGAAQQARELGVQIIGTLSDPTLAVAGGYAALRASARSRISASLAAGVADGEWAGRGELLGHFLLGPGERRRPGFYVAGGLAGVVGAVHRGYLVLTAGVEAQPGTDSGWALELGVGGGFRVALGYRWRRFAGVAAQ
jgi:hypothetical protein